MKQIIQYMVRLRNPNFSLPQTVDSRMLVSFLFQQIIAMGRGALILFLLRQPRFMLRGRSVKFYYLHHIRWGLFLKLGDGSYISGLGTGIINFGNNVSIGAYSRVIISTTLNNPGAFITIGNNVGIGEFSYLGGAGGLTIGDDCIIGQYFSCHPENHLHENLALPIRLQGVSRKGILIGNNCWVGSKVTILDGVSIGDGCVVAAGAVVNKSFPANSVIGGVPAKILRSRAGLTLEELSLQMSQV